LEKIVADINGLCVERHRPDHFFLGFKPLKSFNRYAPFKSFRSGKSSSVKPDICYLNGWNDLNVDCIIARRSASRSAT